MPPTFRRRWRVATFAIIPALFFGTDVRSAEPTPVDFAREILPILSTNCFACHGPDAKHRAADLRLDDEAAAKEYAIVPGSPDDSEVLVRILSDDDDSRMPPPKVGKRLTEEEVSLVKRWIQQGAPWARHWAFVPPVRQAVPDSGDSQWPHNDIDRFVLQRLNSEGLAPSPPARRAAWLRRVSFDLTGLPPTPEEAAAFERDTSTDAYEQVVERLLQSPHYGERIAIEWLDLARFADTNGYQNDFNRSMWPWRDWVIQAYNDNMPGNQFLIEQIAGDLLPDPTDSQRIATGFNRNHRTVTEAGSIDEEWRVENVVDRVETTATAFLGLTMGCARCHDHKYDPISRKDFYQFFAFFNNVDEKGVYTETRGNVAPLISVPTREQQEKLAALDRQLAELTATRDDTTVDFEKWFRVPDSAEAADALPPTPVARLVAEKRLMCADSEETAACRYEAGEPTWVTGPAGAAIELNGTAASHVDAGQAVDFDADQPFSWSLWARVDAPGALLSKMDDKRGYRGFDTIVLDDYRLKVHLIANWPGDALAVTTKIPIPRDAWFHLAVSYDGKRKAEGIQLWLDGHSLPLNLEQKELAGTLQTDQPLRLGRRSTALFLDGLLADVRLFDRPLTAAQVDAMRRSQVRAQVPGATIVSEQAPSAVKEYLVREQAHELQQQIDQLQEERQRFEESLETTMVMRDRAEYRPTYLLTRGQYDAPDTSETLWPQVPAFLGQLPEDAPHNRLGLAHWLVEPDNPLVARVMVNRIWQRMFGVGLVATGDNFGVQGDPPSHPQLLDWLALHLIDSGWNIKEMHKLIALSATYQQASDAVPELIKRDPKNRLLARGPRHRLAAELLRDNALAVSGLLTRKIGGRSVKPYQPDGLWEELAGGANGGPYVVETDENLYRRSLYTFRKRTVSHPTLATFDAPSWEICQAKRAATNTPLQALALLNDTTYVEAARHLAQRMVKEGGGDVRSQVRRGFLLTTLREPKDAEVETLVNGYQKYLEFYHQDPAAAKDFLSQGASQWSDERKTPEMASLATVAAVLLNLDETITK